MTPPPDRRARRRQQTLAHLADTAWALFEAEGYEPVTMEQIAARADVAKATLYKHFPVKEALLRYRFHREFATQVPALLEHLAALPTATARLRSYLAASAAWAEDHRSYLLPYVRLRLGEVGSPKPRDEGDRSGNARVFFQLIAEGQQGGEFRPDFPAELMAHHAEFLYLGVLLRWLLGDPAPLATAFDRMVDFLCGGLLVPPDRS
ncbi:MAG: TetR/AcrR family transcriptional regulator [Zoogloeaceae bacterium]|nr:TetR/AcrR family transcriptional regulator [Zoogloeaceae bacterium]